MLSVRSLVAAALLLWAASAPAQQGGDLQAQILYAYQTEDGNALANLIQDLTTQAKADAGDASLKYHLAHAQYRSGLLAGSRRRRSAGRAGIFGLHRSAQTLGWRMMSNRWRP